MILTDDRLSKLSTCGTEHGGACEHDSSNSSEAAPFVKVKFAYKLMNFTCAVIALSWFFEGWRKINESPSVPHFGILLVGTVLTLLFLGVHGYWVYFEEKAKGTLKKRVELFEKINAKLQARREARVIVTDKGEN